MLTHAANRKGYMRRAMTNFRDVAICTDRTIFTKQCSAFVFQPL